MKEVGLVPSDTGTPDSKETGQRMTQYVETGGHFEKASETYLATKDAVFYQDRPGDKEASRTRRKKVANKTKYTCPARGLNPWAKPDAPLVRGDCNQVMEAETQEPEGDGSPASRPSS